LAKREVVGPLIEQQTQGLINRNGSLICYELIPFSRVWKNSISYREGTKRRGEAAQICRGKNREYEIRMLPVSRKGMGTEKGKTKGGL